MKYWDTDYSVVQGIECGVWKWSTLVAKRQSNLTRWPQPRRRLIGRSQRNVSSEDIALEILRRADLAGDELTSSIKAFVDSHLGPDRQLTLRLA